MCICHSRMTEIVIGFSEQRMNYVKVSLGTPRDTDPYVRWRTNRQGNQSRSPHSLGLTADANEYEYSAPDTSFGEFQDWYQRLLPFQTQCG